MNNPDQGRRTLGPVTDLERHLPAEWWRTLFNALYLKTDGDVVENSANTSAEVDAVIATVGLKRTDRILDLCCGQGRHVLEFARRGFQNVTGLDRSRTLIRLARNRARKERLTVRFHEGDARRFRLPPESFDCVAILGNSFGYFERDSDDLAVLRSVSRVLKNEGSILLDLADGDWLRRNFEPRSWEWIDQDHFVCRERALADDKERLVSREVVVHAEQGVIADQFYAERLYTPARIERLLVRAGFRNIDVSSGTKTHSDRNQDLGMMEHRMLIKATSRVKESKAPQRVPFPKVTVLLGDSSRPDPVKRNGKFNEEDFQTLDRLRAALGKLPGYRFEYLDRHDDFITKLSTNRPDFVLNFCDEGLGNDALRELHVPALLEILGIPYSGAGPAALGLCYDKEIVNGIARSLEIPVPEETCFDPADRGATIPSVFPALVKPACGDSSIGITKHAVVYDAEQLIDRLSALRDELPGVPILVQEFLSGAEYTVAIVGNPGLSYEVLPILEVDYDHLEAGLPRILSYESKWEPDSPYWSQIRYIESKAPVDLKNSLFDTSVLLFQKLDCRDYARFDFRADANGVPKLLEVNPNPGWCWDGKLNLMAELAGWSYSDLLARILEAAQERTLAAREARAAHRRGGDPDFSAGVGETGA
jgi:D-alanine-D-alanine ligase